MKRGDITTAWRVTAATVPDAWDLGLRRHDGGYEAWTNPSDDLREISAFAVTPDGALLSLARRILDHTGGADGIPYEDLLEGILGETPR